MRATRIITAILAFALMGLLPLAGASSAGAATSSAKATNAPVAARANIQIGIKIVKKRGKLVLVGNIRPAKRYGVTIQKATRCNKKQGTCNFKFYRKVNANKRGHYQARVYAPQHGSWAWRARVGTTTSDIWVTCKRRSPGAQCPTP